ncbi:hypothetical protein [Ilumatobacter nonamiensis]|uniref:hypothetical protein n=1 Tax=Ilumatobacter nonamiensis TaxID=467093 RepID=UPI000345523A|nr:hypothetical protein [Ilumatobacter nonamiensis]
MQTLASERWAPTTSSIGFLELPLDEAVDALETWRRSLYPSVTTSRLVGIENGFARLEPLMGGCRPREMLTSMGPSWTAYFDCGLRGTDAVSTIGHLSSTVRCQGVAVRCVPHTSAHGDRPARLGAVQFEMFGPVPTDFLNYVRTISVAHTGSRWRFDANGTVQAFEETDRYSSRKIRDRFTSEMLEAYCGALGIQVFDLDAYGPDVVMVESDVPRSPTGSILTRAETQQWLGIEPGKADSMPG